jgi:cysteine/O-acetylserine efflux protein
MSFPLAPFISFAVVTTLTPGPNNISSAGFGFKNGYVKTLKFMAGINIGFIGIMVVTSLFSTILSMYLPRFFPYLKYIGAGYIVFLAIRIMLSKSFDEGFQGGKAGVVDGIVLQILNPKVIIYGLTVFTVFVHPNVEKISLHIVISLALAVLVFVSNSLWALSGNAIKLLLKKERYYRIINIVLGLLLIYSDVSIVLSDVTV